MRKTNVILMSILAWTSAVAVSHAEGSNPTMYSETGMFEPRIVLAQAGQDAAKKHMEEGSRGVTPQPLTSGQMEDMRKHNDEMEAHMRDMQALLDKIAATKDPRERRTLVEKHRAGMHEMMRNMRGTSGEMRMGMMSGGPRSGQPVPKGEKLRQHLLEKRLDMMDMMMHQMMQRDDISAIDQMSKHNDEMEVHMKDMQGLLDKIAATKDPQERRALMEEHRGHMQEMMRTMRSTSSDTRMGMMGGGPRSGHAMPEGETLRQHLLEKRLDMMDMMMDQMTKHSEMMRSTSAQ